MVVKEVYGQGEVGGGCVGGRERMLGRRGMLQIGRPRNTIQRRGGELQGETAILRRWRRSNGYLIEK